ncbi:hypothetical protein T261_04964 [Streptomyces lydicus]|nr:hypothetical protein T261_04964 [Streptomyces lydicus]
MPATSPWGVKETLQSHESPRATAPCSVSPPGRNGRTRGDSSWPGRSVRTRGHASCHGSRPVT